MKTAVVLLNYNGKNYLEQFLPLLVAHTPDKETQIIVADNASTDNSLAFLQANYPHIRCIELSENYGFAEGYNKALKEIDAEYYLLLNTDVAVTENWLSPMVEFLDKNPDVAACQPKIRSYHEPEKFEYAGAAGGFIDKLGYVYCRGRIFTTLEEDKGQYDTVCDVFWATGACFLLRSTEFWASGAFDGNFFAHQEEIDLCWRLHSRGKRVVCLPQSMVYHVGGGTLNTENPMKTFLNFRNNLLMLYKNLPEKELRKTMFFRWILDYFASFVMWLQGKTANAKSVWEARKEYRRTKYLFKRKPALQRNPLMLNGWLLYHYHIMRKKTYLELSLRV